MKYPKGWNKTVDELRSENKDPKVREIKWAIEYERDQLRGTFRFPKNGEIFEALENVKIGCLIHWKAPYTEGEEFILGKSTIIKVKVNDFDPEPVGVYADAIDYEKLEKEIVPEMIRKDKKYNGYSLFISTKVLNNHFRLIVT